MAGDNIGGGYHLYLIDYMHNQNPSVPLLFQFCWLGDWRTGGFATSQASKGPAWHHTGRGFYRCRLVSVHCHLDFIVSARRANISGLEYSRWQAIHLHFVLIRPARHLHGKHQFARRVAC